MDTRTRNKVPKAAYGYVKRNTPLDGIHIDVDLQTSGPVLPHPKVSLKGIIDP